MTVKIEGFKTFPPIYRIFEVLALMLIVIPVTSDLSIGQTSSISGIVTDSSTEKPIPAVLVTVEGLNATTVSDKNGRFKLVRVPVGTHRLIAEVPGYQNQEIPVSVNHGTQLVQHIRLDFLINDGDRVFVRNRKNDEAFANARQLKSLESRHVITSSQMDQAGDFSIRSGLARVPGIQVGRKGELNIRGAGRYNYGVLMDGQRMAATTSGGRGVDLGGISAVMSENVEVIKVTTPDMDAEGVGGVVRINTWQPVGEREIHVNAGGLANPRYTHFTGLGNLASVKYSERYTDEFSMAVNLSYQKENRGYEGLGINYGVADFGTGETDVIEQLSPSLNSEVRNRFGGRIQMDYQPDVTSSYFVQGLLNLDNRTFERHRNLSTANNDWINQTSTGNVGNQGQFAYNPFLNQGDNFFYMLQAGGRHLLDLFTIDYRAGWARSNIEQNQYDFLFSRGNLDYSVNMDNRTRPEMVITNIRLMEDGTVDQRSMNFNSTERIRDEYQEDRYTARLDIEMPVGPVTFKVGSSIQQSDLVRSYEEADLATLRSYNLLRFHKLPRSSFDVFGHYFFPNVIHTDYAARYVDTSRPEMRINDDDMFRRSLIRNFSATENIVGGYGMATLKLSRFMLTGGLRVEQTYGSYHGQRVTYNQFNFFDSNSDTRSSIDYINLFPYAQLMFSPTSTSNIKLAFSRSLMRQDYTFLAPFELISAADTTRFSGNPDLEPVISENLDLFYEHYLRDVGVLSAGVFYKEFSNRIVLQERTIIQSEFPHLVIPEGSAVDVTERTYVNSDQKVNLYGFELAWKQQLRFLPGILGNLGLNANYTWTQSTVDNVRNGEDMALRFQSPHTVNAALNYNYGRYSGQVAWHWTAALLYREATDKQWVPAVNSSEQIFLDLYEDGWMDLSASFGFRISERFRFWASVSNLLPSERILYGHTRDLYPVDTIMQDGLRISTGFRFTL